jgi:hypothetical protein
MCYAVENEFLLPQAFLEAARTQIVDIAEH